jgi:Protein of unknown function (DUF4230)
MQNARKAIVIMAASVLLGFLFLAGIFCGFKVAVLTGAALRPRTPATPALLLQVQALSELTTVKYVIEKVEVLEVPAQSVVGQFIGSQNRVLLLAHGVVKAGIDLDHLQPADLEVSGKRISIKLPAAEIVDAYLDENQTKVIDRTTGLLAPPDKDLEQTARKNALDAIRRAARTNGILSEADVRARAQLINLFTQLGFEKVEFK